MVSTTCRCGTGASSVVSSHCVQMARRLGSVSFADGLRRWLAGTHLAPVADDDLILPASVNRRVVGGIAVSYSALDATHEGRTLIRAVSGVR